MPKKILQGTVVSNSMEKSVKVLVKRKKRHPVYGKYINISKGYIAHDENNTCSVGDVVNIIETPPISKRKRWTVVYND